jgi:hypothetical protein
MIGGGDRGMADLLAALAEAHDFREAAALLLAELSDITGARRLALLRIDAAAERLTAVAMVGDDIDGALCIGIGELSNPFVLCALSLLPLRGWANVRGDTAAAEPIVALPLSRLATLPAMPSTRRWRS